MSHDEVASSCYFACACMWFRVFFRLAIDFVDEHLSLRKSGGPRYDTSILDSAISLFIRNFVTAELGTHSSGMWFACVSSIAEL